MAEEYRERQISAAGMVDAAEAAVRDDVERLLAAIIRVRPPADIAEEARGMAQPLFLRRFVEA